MPVWTAHKTSAAWGADLHQVAAKVSAKVAFAAPIGALALQREEPVDASGRTHGIRHQADVRFGHQSWPERQLYEVQTTSGCGWAVSLLRRLLPIRANWRY